MLYWHRPQFQLNKSPLPWGTFNPRHFNCHQLHDVVQFAGRELSSGLFRSGAARSQCRRFHYERALSNPNTKRDGESGLHDRLHFGATCVSDELRPTSLHTGTIAGRPDHVGQAEAASRGKTLALAKLRRGQTERCCWVHSPISTLLSWLPRLGAGRQRKATAAAPRPKGLCAPPQPRPTTRSRCHGPFILHAFRSSAPDTGSASSSFRSEHT